MLVAGEVAEGSGMDNGRLQRCFLMPTRSPRAVGWMEERAKV